MGGVQGRCLVRRERVLSQFVSQKSSLFSSLSFLSHNVVRRAGFFVNFLAIERLEEGGARQSTQLMNLRRMQIHASPLGIALKIKFTRDNSTCSTLCQLLA